MYKIYKNTIAIAATGLLTITAAASAATIKYEIDFFDDDILVGEGSFSYDNEGELTCFFVQGYYDCYTDSQLVGIFGDRTLDEIAESLFSPYSVFTNPIVDFRANIYTYSTGGDGIYYQWWGDEATGQSEGRVFNSRDGGFIRGGWFFGDSFFGTEQFTIDFAPPYDDFVEGTWRLSVIDPPAGLPLVEPDANYSELSGTFEARRVGTTSPDPTSVPEPSNIFGAIVAMFLGYCAKRKLAQAKQ